MARPKKTTIKPRNAPTKRTFLNSRKSLFYSGFCLTDNKEFAIFYVDDKFLVDNKIKMNLNRFMLSENDLDMEINRDVQIIPEKGVRKYKVEENKYINNELVDLFKKDFPECVFFKLKSFFGKPVNTLLIVLSEEFGKPIGLLKIKKTN